MKNLASYFLNFMAYGATLIAAYFGFSWNDRTVKHVIQRDTQTPTEKYTQVFQNHGEIIYISPWENSIIYLELPVLLFMIILIYGTLSLLFRKARSK